MSKHIIVTSQLCNKRMIEIVDPADIDQRVFALPREISKATSWHIGEVSRSHSTCWKRVVNNHIGLTIREGLNVVLLEIRIGALILLLGDRFPREYVAYP